jgi:hypothetical protein
MGLAFPLAFLLTAVAWLVVVAAIVVSWVPRFASFSARVWRVCIFLTVLLCLLPALFSCVATIDALKYGSAVVPPLMILACSLLAPFTCLFMLRRATLLLSRSPLTIGSSDRGATSPISQGGDR